MDQKTRAERFQNQIQKNNQAAQNQEEQLDRSRRDRMQRRAEKMRREHQRKVRNQMLIGGGCVAAVIAAIIIGKNVFFPNEDNTSEVVAVQSSNGFEAQTEEETTEPVSTEEPYTRKSDEIPDWIDQQLIEKNEFSRPGDPLKKIKDIAIHWVGNAGTTAQNNRNYFANLADPAANPNGTKASSHFIIGLEGEIIQCIPIDEKSYCTNWRNNDTISIEVCHPDWEGKFTDATYQSLVKLTAWLLEQFDLESENMIRHYDVTEKECPKYYVVHEDAWEQMKRDVQAYKDANPSIK